MSAPRFPAKEGHEKAFKPLHGEAEELFPKRSTYYLENAPMMSASDMYYDTHRRLQIEASLNEKERVDVDHEGLGRLPESLPSVSSLLLFNSKENPYKGYKTFDNLSGKNLKLRQQREDNSKAPDAGLSFLLCLFSFFLVTSFFSQRRRLWEG